ncbi:TPA: undecaprenyl-diphosphatase [Patescibacteria group bacterium]|jgi:undecaprenyl-diphosphatase|nr:undecaprenyl-diphosphatase [Patescibacteria group bacterium]
MLNLLYAGLLGIVEGITEFLPISSTAHLILTAKLLNLPQTEYLKSFEIIIQLGAISSVVVLYWKQLWQWEVIKRLIVAFIPTGIIGLIAYKFAKQYLLGNTSVVLWTLLIGGILIIIFEYLYKEGESGSQEMATISYKQCLAIGLFQSVAIVPGVSRSAATVIGGLLLGLNRKTIVEFSFLLAVPTMLAASGLDLIKSADQFSKDQVGFLAVGFVVSFVVALLSIKFLLRYIKNHDFKAFGIYRIAIAILLWLGMK